MPSISTCPVPVSYSRVIRLISVDLPAPVWPTSPSTSPAATRRSMSCSTGLLGSYAKVTPRSSTAPCRCGSATGSARSATSGTASTTSKMRCAEFIAIDHHSTTIVMKRSGSYSSAA